MIRLDWFTGLVVLSIIVGLTAPFIHLYIAYVYVPRKFTKSLFDMKTAKAAVALLRQVLTYKETEDQPTVFQELCGALGAYLGTYLGKYIGGGIGRGNRQINNAALDAVAENVPIVKALMGIPGFKKFLNHPLVAQYVVPIMEKSVAQMAQQEAPQQ